ncbi:MAG: hypothetical protein ACYC9O_12240 [Candidatus Latescibacterota bacterium]
MYRRIALVFSLIMLCSVTVYAAPAPNYSKLVHPGPDGRLAYVPDEQGNTVPDFSHAGYLGGGVRLPKVKVKAEVKPGVGNDSERIQAAIDLVSALAPDKDGFRGAVLIKKGRYILEKRLQVTAGGVVLRGEGQGGDGTVLFGKGSFPEPSFNEKTESLNLIEITGASGAQEVPGSAARIRDEYVPLGARSFRVASASNFRTGDTVIVRRFGNREWWEALKLDPKQFRENIRHDAERTITAIEGDRITVDVSLPIAIEARWGGGELVKFTDSGRISQVGVENLRGESDFDRSVRTNKFGNMDRTNYIGFEYYSDENHYFNFIRMVNVRDAWVRDITAIHFARSAVNVAEGSKRTTVQDCTSLEPVSLCAGSRRFTFLISGQLCLVQRCKSDRGRHSFVLGGTANCGPNVFLNCEATRPYGSSEPHASLIVATLYDNVKAPLAFRYATSVPPRWMNFNSFAWNCEGMFITQKPPAAQNYFIGHTGLFAMIFNRGLIDYSWPDGYVESLDDKVEPRSLYLKQLEDRLGKQAVKNIER